MTNPLISIVICCHNRANLLPSTMQSVFEQKYRPIEIVVVDDGSIDGTRELMSQYGDKIRYYWHENKGVAKTRTIACNYANGEYIAFLDDDDLMPPDRLEILYSELSKFPDAVFSVGDWAEIGADNRLTGRRWLPKGKLSESSSIFIANGYEAVLWPTIPATPHTTLFKKSAGCSIGWFDESFIRTSEDKDFFARLAAIGPVIYVPRVVSYYRRGHDSLTLSKRNVPLDRAMLFKKHLNLFNSANDRLRKRLELRLFRILKKTCTYRYSKFFNPSLHHKYLEFEKDVLKNLTLLDNLAFFVFKHFKLPLKKYLGNNHKRYSP